MTLTALFAQQSYGSLVDGVEWRHQGTPVPFVSPTTDRPWKELFATDEAGTYRAIEAAYGAQTAWRATTGHERALILLCVAQGMLDHRDQLALVMAMEMGKTLSEGRAEVEYAAGYFHWFAGEAQRLYGCSIPSAHPGTRLLLQHEPVGICALITPWNFPLAMPARKLAAALAAGCTMVLKPSPLTFVSSLLMGHICLHAGVPAGVVNVLYGPDADIGRALTTSSLVRKLSFTGSVPVGKMLYAACAASLKRVTLELGGHAPFIVCHDADLAEAVEGAVTSKLRNSGQTCVSPVRYLVHESLYERFVEAFSAALLSQKVGDPLDPATQVSRVLHPTSRTKVVDYVEDAVRKGAKLFTQGDDPSFPKVLAGVEPTMRIFHEEPFGPVAAVTPFHSYEEALRLANATEYGLAAYLYAQRSGLIQFFTEGLHFGILSVNHVKLSSPEVSFGGVKQSGMGREGGPTGIYDYLVEKSISTAL